jgi:hypothetical protein
MRKTFGIERRSFLHIPIPEVTHMPLKHFLSVPKHPHKSEPSPAQLFIPHFHILILAWSAFVIVYGDPG